MGEVVGNILVMVFFGFLLGTMLKVTDVFLGPRHRSRQTRKPEESYSSYIMRLAKQDSEKRVLDTYSKPALISMAVFYGIIAMLVLLINFSPLQMHWLAFLPSVFAGFCVVMWIFERAKAGKIQVKGRFFFDITPDQESPDLSDQQPPNP